MDLTTSDTSDALDIAASTNPTEVCSPPQMPLGPACCLLPPPLYYLQAATAAAWDITQAAEVAYYQRPAAAGTSYDEVGYYAARFHYDTLNERYISQMNRWLQQLPETVCALCGYYTRNYSLCWECQQHREDTDPCTASYYYAA